MRIAIAVVGFSMVGLRVRNVVRRRSQRRLGSASGEGIFNRSERRVNGLELVVVWGFSTALVFVVLAGVLALASLPPWAFVTSLAFAGAGFLGAGLAEAALIWIDEDS